MTGPAPPLYPPPTGAAQPGPSTGPAIAGLAGSWERLHPLSPLVRAGRGLIAIMVIVVLPLLGGGQKGSLGNDLIHLAGIPVLLIVGVVSWLVTRWRVEGGVLRVDSGLIRRTSERFPLSQIQAIDTVRPGLARMFGVAELRIRLAGGGGKAGRLAYLGNAEAEVLRARLLALAHGVAETTPAPPEQTLLTVAPGQLFASILLTGTGLVLEVAIVALVVLAIVAPGAAGAALSAGAAGFFGLAVGLFRRFNGDYRLTVAEAPDGLRLRSGLVETSAETIPRGRVQAVRMVEPLAWRPFGWCRLEVSVASQKSKGRQDRAQAKAARALLPVGSHQQAAWLLGRVFPDLPVDRSAPPPRARWKSPLRFRLLSWAANDRYAVTTSGRVRRVTDWVPLDKVQSVRRVEGPIQRRLGLASVHLDTAGRRVHSVARDRDAAEAAAMVVDLPQRCRQARRREGAGRPARSPKPI
ncbi:MAG: PH domain-containing protein [Actinomycetota bacterium]|nr:PH domain-containing protein [Actinomycetota bacterium]